MICIAIFSIFLAITVNRADTGGWLSHESDYRLALRSARLQLETLRRQSFDSLPPQQLRTGQGGWVQLAQRQLVPGQFTSSAAILQTHADKGRLQVNAAPGTLVLVNYAYFVADQGEAHTVQAGNPAFIDLRNTPVLTVESVRAFRGAQSQPVPYTRQGDRLHFSSQLVGQVVQVDYSGKRVRNQVSGLFLDDALQATAVPSRHKLITVKEAYGRQGVARMQLSLVKSQ